MSTLGGLPAIDTAALPADVRNDPQRKQQYVAALSFERQLVNELAKTLAKTSAPEDDSASAATKTYREMLPGTLADAITAGGGIGLAAQLVTPKEQA